MACMNPAHLNLVKRDFISEFSAIKKEHPEMLELPAPDYIKQLAEGKKMGSISLTPSEDE